MCSVIPIMYNATVAYLLDEYQKHKNNPNLAKFLVQQLNREVQDAKR